MTTSKGWPLATSFEDYLTHLNKRIGKVERGGVPLANADTTLGPGLAPKARELRDWNDPEALFNGFYYSQVGALNTPDSTKSWTGQVIAKDDGTGLQQVWYTGSTEFTLYYLRTYTPVVGDEGRVVFGEWKRFATESGLIDTEDLAPQVVTNIDTALGEAAQAIEHALASNSTFRQPTAPVSTPEYTLRDGDIWFDTDDQNKTYIWNGSTWIDTRDSGIAAAAAAAAQGQADAAAALSAAAAAQGTANSANTAATAANTAAADASLAAASASLQGTNKVVNGGAESDLFGWTPEFGTVSVTTARARGGTKSFTAANGGLTQAGFPVVVGDTWRFEGWFQLSNVSGSGGLRLQSSTDGTSWSDTVINDLNGTLSTWTYNKVEYTIPAGVTHLRARIAFAYATGTAWVDDLALYNLTQTGMVIQSTETANRGIKFNNQALVGYSDGSAGQPAAGTPTFSLTSATGALSLLGPVVTGGSVTGSTLQTTAATTGGGLPLGVKITSAGIVGYDTAGTPKFALDASTGQVTSLDVTAGTITGALVQTSATAARGVKLTSTGLYGYDGVGNEKFRLLTDGSMLLTGTVTSGGTIDGAIVTGGTLQTSSAANTGVKISSGGITGYNSVGSPTFVLNANTGQVTSIDVTAGTITGATIKTNPGTGNTARVEMTSSGIYAYNGSGETFALTTSGGSGQFSGTLTTFNGSGGYAQLGGGVAVGYDFSGFKTFEADWNAVRMWNNGVVQCSMTDGGEVSATNRMIAPYFVSQGPSSSSFTHGLSLAGGVTVSSGGITINGGGLAVNAGGLTANSYGGAGITKNSTAVGTINGGAIANGSFSNALNSASAIFVLTVESSVGQCFAQITSITSSTVSYRVTNQGTNQATGVRLNWIGFV